MRLPHLPPHRSRPTHENAVTSSHEDQFARENAALSRLLRRALAHASPALPNDRALSILDLACGPCREAETLIHSLREVSGSSSDIRLVGADIRRAELDEAASRARAAGLAHTEFLAADCSKLDHALASSENFDLTFLRHQNFWNDPAAWLRIFEHGLSRLNDDGLLVITSYFDREHALAVKALERAGAELVVSARNDDSIDLSTHGKSVDRHLAVFRRRPARRP